ncbi:hypothetical protein KC866_00970 [Patescibacteria group bacterium]|nr:hypothetical protein [Patescibacteria group bacterium]
MLSNKKYILAKLHRINRVWITQKDDTIIISLIFSYQNERKVFTIPTINWQDHLSPILELLNRYQGTAISCTKGKYWNEESIEKVMQKPSNPNLFSSIFAEFKKIVWDKCIVELEVQRTKTFA